MLPAVVELTAEVVTVKFAADAASGIVTEFGTAAVGLALTKLTTAPPVGAEPERVSVAVVD